MADRRLNSLSPRFKPLAFELLARCVEAQISVLIVNTRRTPAEQAQNIANGVSWTTNSRHLTGDAIDIVPYSQFDLHGPDKLLWDAGDPIWLKLGAIGKALGLRWGGDWTQKDLGHFEYVEPIPTTTSA